MIIIYYEDKYHVPYHSLSISFLCIACPSLRPSEAHAERRVSRADAVPAAHCGASPSDGPRPDGSATAYPLSSDRRFAARTLVGDALLCERSGRGSGAGRGEQEDHRQNHE